MAEELGHEADEVLVDLLFSRLDPGDLLLESPVSHPFRLLPDWIIDPAIVAELGLSLKACAIAWSYGARRCDR